jgi:predicted DNA-binding protein with PD1-like motif
MLIRDLDFSRIFFARLDRGEDIILQIAHLAGKKAVKTGYFSAIGSFSRAELSYYDQATREYCRISI